MAAYVLVTTITNAGYGEQLTYRAEFTDVAGLVEGDEVRIAGVRVGQVTGIGLAEEHRDRPVAEVELEVSADVPLPAAVEATIRYRNLVGQRYIALTEGEGSGGETLDEGAVIPLAQTTPALDLTVLFGGFQPLFQALSPADVNRLSFEIIQVFQGEGGTMESLLAHVGSLTNTLADRDHVIGSVIDNLTTVMGTARRPRPAVVGPGGQPAAVRHRPGRRPGRDLRLAADHRRAGDLDQRLPRGGPGAAGRGHPGARATCRATWPTPATWSSDSCRPPREARPDDPDRDQRQLVQLLPVPRRRARSPLPAHPAGPGRPAGHGQRVRLDSGAEGCS